MAKNSRIVALLWLLLLAVAANAQAPALVVSGSAVVNPIIAQFPPLDPLRLELTDTGSRRGLAQLCTGEAELATATRQISADERALCEANAVQFSELLLGYYLAALVAHPDVPLQCLSESQVGDIFKPSSSNVLNTWSFAGEEGDELPLTLLLPAADTIASSILDGIVPGDGLRLDGLPYNTERDALQLLRNNAGSLALLPWTTELASADDLQLLSISAESSGNCATPSAEAVDNDRYPASLPLFVYLNRARADAHGSIATWLGSLFSPLAGDILLAQGVVPPSPAVVQLNESILADPDAASNFRGDEQDFTIPSNLDGEIVLAGTAIAHEALTRAAAGLGAAVTLQPNYRGIPQGLESLCSGEADLIALDDSLPAESLESCSERDVPTRHLALGAQATVLLGNKGDSFNACLTSAELQRIWAATAASDVHTWADVDARFAETELALTLFGLAFADSSSDLLLRVDKGPAPPVRADTEKDASPHYRAAAVANVPGALSYMDWFDYQALPANSLVGTRLLAIDAGAGCTLPSPTTIQGGDYPLSLQSGLLLRDEALAAPLLQSLVWELLSETQWAQMADSEFLGASLVELPALRREALRWFTEAQSSYPPSAASVSASDEVESADA